MLRTHLRRRNSQASLQPHSSTTTTIRRHVRSVATRCVQEARYMRRKGSFVKHPEAIAAWKRSGKMPGLDNGAKSTSFLDLPYELREQIYLCVHKLSCVYKETERSQPIWSCLASSCHQVYDEMRNIPLHYMLKSIEEAWINAGAISPLQIVMSDRSYREKRVTVFVPRGFLEYDGCGVPPSCVYAKCFTILSALLHLHTNSIVLSLYDDGAPPLEGVGQNLLALAQYLVFVLDLLSTRQSKGSRCSAKSPMRQVGLMYQMKVINTKEVVLLWYGFRDPLIPQANWYLQHIVRVWTWCRRGGIPQCFTFSGNQLPYLRPRMFDTDNDMQRLAITSSTEFRPIRQWRTAVEKQLMPSQVFAQRFLSNQG